MCKVELSLTLLITAPLKLRFSVSRQFTAYVDNDCIVKYLLNDSTDLVPLNIPAQQRNTSNSAK